MDLTIFNQGHSSNLIKMKENNLGFEIRVPSGFPRIFIRRDESVRKRNLRNTDWESLNSTLKDKLCWCDGECH